MKCPQSVLISLLLLVAPFTACGDSGGDEPLTDATSDAPVCEVEPTLASLTEHYFSKSCSFDSCHGSKKAGGLDLKGDIHAALVNVPAVHDGAAANGKMLVVPNDPDASYLVQKVEGPDADEGDIMPQNAPEPMDPECRIKMLRQWIQDGANP
jgi:hypothetical protein